MPVSADNSEGFSFQPVVRLWFQQVQGIMEKWAAVEEVATVTHRIPPEPEVKGSLFPLEAGVSVSSLVAVIKYLEGCIRLIVQGYCPSGNGSL